MTDHRDIPPHMGLDPTSKDGEPVEWARMLEDWVTIWQSEIAGLVVDREAQEALLRAGDLWGAQARAAIGALSPVLRAAADDRPHGRAGADAAAGSATVDAAPDGRDHVQKQRDAIVEQLLERVAELERRVGCFSLAGTITEN